VKTERDDKRLRYIGLISGTSVDAIDLALLEKQQNRWQLVADHQHPLDPQLRQQIHSCCLPTAQIKLRDPKVLTNNNRIELLGQLDHQIGQAFADAVNYFLSQHQINPDSITAIGSHGQTVRHRPDGGLAGEAPFSIQLGDANLIAHLTGITTVADFRRMDMAAGGQGAPLVPAFHNAILRDARENRIILNLGGIANVTLLPRSPEDPVLGFDTGPANTLLDANFSRHHDKSGESFDRDGQFSQQGKVDEGLLNSMLTDQYFSLLPPKSSGREYFNLGWLQRHLDKSDEKISGQDLQATLTALTCQSIAAAIKKLNLPDYRVYACGGGMHNQFLLAQLSQQLELSVGRTNDLGVDGDSLEAMTFAWLAHRRLQMLPGNLPSVTGASAAKILGAVYQP